MKQAELAELAEVSPSYPSKWLSGEKRPSSEILAKVAVALHADRDELLLLAGYPALATGERPSLPGWERLNEEDRAYVRSLVSQMAEGRRRAEEFAAARVSVTPPDLRDLDEREREAVMAAPEESRQAVADTMRLLHAIDRGKDEPGEWAERQPLRGPGRVRVRR